MLVLVAPASVCNRSKISVQSFCQNLVPTLAKRTASLSKVHAFAINDPEYVHDVWIAEKNRQGLHSFVISETSFSFSFLSPIYQWICMVMGR
jgi:hypothetical protein